KTNRVLIEREEYRNLANNCYRKRKQNDEWVLRKSEDKSRRKADKGKSTSGSQNIKVNKKDNLEIAMGIIKKKEAITMGSGCKMTLSNKQRTEQFRKKENQKEELGKKLSLDTNNAEQKVQGPGKSCLTWLKNIGFDLEVLIQNSEIEEIDEVTESDYSLVWSMLETNRILSYSKLEEAVNAEWDEISEAIVQAANKKIPYIKVRKMEAHFKKTIQKA
ncbi:20339_t:CDS:2, partial [Gigaspora margarita]